MDYAGIFDHLTVDLSLDICLDSTTCLRHTQIFMGDLIPIPDCQNLLQEPFTIPGINGF